MWNFSKSNKLPAEIENHQGKNTNKIPKKREKTNFAKIEKRKKENGKKMCKKMCFCSLQLLFFAYAQFDTTRGRDFKAKFIFQENGKKSKKKEKKENTMKKEISFQANTSCAFGLFVDQHGCSFIEYLSSKEIKINTLGLLMCRHTRKELCRAVDQLFVECAFGLLEFYSSLQRRFQIEKAKKQIQFCENRGQLHSFSFSANGGP